MLALDEPNPGPVSLCCAERGGAVGGPAVIPDEHDMPTHPT